MAKRLLFISNGHGEDNHSAHVIRALRAERPELDILALPIVGHGNAYRSLDIEVLGPNAEMPSGGFTYVDRRLLIDDLRAGLLTLTLRQWRTMRRVAPACDLVFATGDSIGQTFAYGSRRPFISFISCLSALYEGNLKLDLLLQLWFRSRRCRAVFTRDEATAENLLQQGYAKAKFGGIPSLDFMVPENVDLNRNRALPCVLLLPGSRLPEAERNLRLQMQLVQEALRAGRGKMEFYAALVPKLMRDLPEIANSEGWTWQPPHTLFRESEGVRTEIKCFDNAFNALVHECSLVLGMAGLAVDQAVALGKYVLLVAGEGPQHNWRFAEAQSRLLGAASELAPATDGGKTDRASTGRRIAELVASADYLKEKGDFGRERLGEPGASGRIVKKILEELDSTRRV